MVKIIAIVIAVLAFAAVAFVAWRWNSVERGASERDEKLIAVLDPIAKRLETGVPVTPHEIQALAARPEIRYMLFALLREMKRADLLPTGYSSSVAQGESALVYWMLHPNELQAAPEKIELVETVQRTIEGQQAVFQVFRYRMPPGHWAAKNGWELGLVGPMPSGSEPYSERPGAFARGGDIEGKVKPSELVDWYIDLVRQKS